ncbi:MAG: hypothetical protein Q7O66_23620 [Dehalococcoidia bacterium]|nr:hypothetical protein [Dehalococcoidia bacterium]
MECLDIGRLRAYCDGEIASPEASKIEGHISQCVTCKEQLNGVRQAGSFVTAKLNAIAPLPTEAPPGFEASLAALRRRESRLGGSADTRSRSAGGPGFAGRIGAMFATATNHWRLSAASLTAAAIVLSVLALPPVRTVADDLLGVFRVQKFTQVSLDPAALTNLPMVDPSKMGAFDSSTQKLNTYTVSSPAEAAAKLNFPLRLPQQIPIGVAKVPKFTVLDSFSVGYTFDMAQATNYLDSMGMRGISLPKSLSGRKISATIPVHLITTYGEEGTDRGMVLFQGRSPVVEVPDGVNMDEVFNTIYAIPGLPPELVVQLRAIDWKTTAPVPVLKGDTSQKLTLDGVEGLLVRNDLQKMTVLFWQKDGVVYVLAGQVPDSDLIASANSFK